MKRKTIRNIIIVLLILLCAGIGVVVPSAQGGEWWADCPPDPPTRTPWPEQPTLTPQPTYTPAETPTCRPTATLAANPSPTPYPTHTSYPTSTAYPIQPYTITATPISTDCDLFIAPDGDDGNPGTEAQPFLTVQYGVNTMASGDVLCLRAGTYTEGIHDIPSGTDGNPTIDAGLTLSEVPDDLDGVARPQGTGYDIGAYEQ